MLKKYSTTLIVILDFLSLIIAIAFLKTAKEALLLPFLIFFYYSTVQIFKKSFAPERDVKLFIYSSLVIVLSGLMLAFSQGSQDFFIYPFVIWMFIFARFFVGRIIYYLFKHGAF